MYKNFIKNHYYFIFTFMMFLVLLISVSPAKAEDGDLVLERVGPPGGGYYNPSGYNNSPVEVNLQTGKNNYAIGEQMDIYLTTNQPVYILLYYVSTDGSAAIIVPSSYSGKNYLQPGNTYSVRDNYGKKLVQYGPAGAEYLQVVSSKNPINLNNYSYYLRENSYSLEITNPEAFLRAVIDDIQSGSNNSYNGNNSYNSYSGNNNYYYSPYNSNYNYNGKVGVEFTDSAVGPQNGGSYVPAGYGGFNNYDYSLDSVGYKVYRNGYYNNNPCNHQTYSTNPYYNSPWDVSKVGGLEQIQVFLELIELFTK